MCETPSFELLWFTRHSESLRRLVRYAASPEAKGEMYRRRDMGYVISVVELLFGFLATLFRGQTLLQGSKKGREESSVNKMKVST